MLSSRVGWVTIYLLCVLAWPDSPEQMSSSLAYPASSSSHASCTGSSTLSQKRWVPDHWCNSSSTSSPWLSRVVEAWLNWFDGCPATVVEKGDKLMMDSPNTESVWPSLLLNTEKNVMRIIISRNLWFQWVEFQSVGEILFNIFKWKLLFCGAADYWGSCGIVCCAVQGGCNFPECGWNPMLWPFKWKLLSSTFLWYCLLCCTRWF